MAAAPPRASSGGQGVHLVLYDGMCGLCNGLVQFLLAHDDRAVFVFASLQSATGQAIVERWGGNPREPSSFYVIANHRTPAARAFARSDAALFLACELRWPWKAGRLLRILPRRLRDRLYDAVARVRYRVFGRHDQCLIPAPEFRSRFVD